LARVLWAVRKPAASWTSESTIAAHSQRTSKRFAAGISNENTKLRIYEKRTNRIAHLVLEHVLREEHLGGVLKLRLVGHDKERPAKSVRKGGSRKGVKE
jgi:hypothetical protein